VNTDSRQGRYLRYRFPGGKVRDIAFDATLRAAAPFQNFRKNANLAVVIKSSDIREKVKEKHTGCIVLFVVDASGSMGAMKRMGAVKGAVISMLDEAYKKRDRVGVVAFRKQGADTLLGITRSIDLAYQCLRELPTGGKTPMAAGLARGYELLKTAAIKEPDLLPYLVLVSDGKTNVSLEGTNPVDDVLRIACRIRNEGIRSMVIDTEEGYIRLGMAKKISEALNAEYVKLDNVTAQGISSSVKHIIS
jgi:magnesium chelatase subunit D